MRQWSVWSVLPCLWCTSFRGFANIMSAIRDIWWVLIWNAIWGSSFLIITKSYLFLTTIRTIPVRWWVSWCPIFLIFPKWHIMARKIFSFLWSKLSDRLCSCLWSTGNWLSRFWCSYFLWSFFLTDRIVKCKRPFWTTAKRLGTLTQVYRIH